jgi:hypothetical protein
MGCQLRYVAFDEAAMPSHGYVIICTSTVDHKPVSPFIEPLKTDIDSTKCLSLENLFETDIWN